MPTPRVLSASCPECSAPVRITRDREIVTCRYCGHHAFVHFPGKPDPRPPPPPPPPPHVPVQHYYQSYYRPYAQYGHIHVDVLQRIHGRQLKAAILTVVGIFVFAVTTVSIIAAAMPGRRTAPTGSQPRPDPSKVIYPETHPHDALLMVFGALRGKQAYRVEVRHFLDGALVPGKSSVRVYASAMGDSRTLFELAELVEVESSSTTVAPAGTRALSSGDWCWFNRLMHSLPSVGINVKVPLDFVLSNEEPVRWVVTYSDGTPGKVFVNADTCEVTTEASPPASVRPPTSRPAPKPGPKPLKVRGRAL